MTISLYFHFPYCIKKCPYCDFNSYGVGGVFPEKNYVDSMLKEIEFYGSLIGGHDIKSVYFGGGTPSLLSAGSIARIIDKINLIARLEQNAEITIEVNPKTASYTKFKDFRLAAINRVSLGIQSFSARKLNILERLNSPLDNFETIDDLKRAGIDNINIDLIYGLPDECIEEWDNDLSKTTGLFPSHISAYCLTMEEGTEFHKRYTNGDLIIPDENEILSLIEHTQSFLINSGYMQYEISNYALPGYESIHNSAYWKGENYIGIGAGAHSHIGSCTDRHRGTRWSNLKSPSRYMNSISRGLKPVDFEEELSTTQSFKDSVMMGLRLAEGIDTDKIKLRYDMVFDFENLKYLFEDGYLKRDRNLISLNSKGIPVSNYIIFQLIENSHTSGQV